MVKKKLIPLILSVTIAASFGLIGCGKNKNTTPDNGKNAVSEAADDVKDTAEGLWDKVTDTSMDFKEEKLKSQLEDQGYDLKKVDSTDSYFSVDSNTYEIDGDNLAVYEYGENDTEVMKTDINSITNEGAKINNKDVNWKSNPHVYKKGRVVAIYDGDNSKILDTLKNVLGDPILG